MGHYLELHPKPFTPKSLNILEALVHQIIRIVLASTFPSKEYRECLFANLILLHSVLLFNRVKWFDHRCKPENTAVKVTEDPAMSAILNQNLGLLLKDQIPLQCSEAITFNLYLLLSCSVPTTASDVLLAESIRWYTGENGQVDHVLARDLLEQSVTEGDSLSVMWLARVYMSGVTHRTKIKHKNFDFCCG